MNKVCPKERSSNRLHATRKAWKTGKAEAGLLGSTLTNRGLRHLVGCENTVSTALGFCLSGE